MIKIKNILLPLLLGALTSCNEVKFSSEYTHFGSSSNASLELNDINGIYDLNSAINRDSIWIAANTSTGKNVYQIILDETNNFPLKKWTLNTSPSSGNRTYVSEAGLLVGTRGGKLFAIREDTPTTSTISPVWVAPEANTLTRMCISSYKHLDQSYAVVLWEKDISTVTTRQLSRIPLKTDKTLDTQQIKTWSLGAGNWSYSCFLDSNNKIIWGAWYPGSGTIPLYGFDLINESEVNGNKAPNQAFTTNALSEYFTSPSTSTSGSYALSGDSKGNILSGKQIYTYAHDSRNNIVIGSLRGASQILIAKDDCYYSDIACTQKYSLLDISQLGRVGPLSSLNDGRIAGIVRGSSTSQVYILKVKDPNNVSSGIEAVRIKEVEGNAYMYSDFTGGGLYANTQSLVIDLSKISNFKENLITETLNFTWFAQAGGSAEWSNLNLYARCYQKSNNLGIPFKEVTNIDSAGSKNLINVDSCKNKIFNTLELKLKGTGTGSEFSRTSKIQISGTQKN